MGRYITANDVSRRYPEVLKTKDAAMINEDYIPLAEAELDERLASQFTVPFSSNNMTARDLSIELTYAKIYRWKDPKKVKKIDEYVNKRVADLLAGKSAMVDSAGAPLSEVGGTVYSTTQNYHPLFGMGNIEDMHVSSAQLVDEENARQ